MQINIKMDTRSIKMAIRNVKKYQQRLQDACKKFVDRLADEGISAAKRNEGEYAGAILYYKRFEPKTAGCTGILIASGVLIKREYRSEGVVKAVYVDALGMAEFGSGWLADNDGGQLWGIANVGQGTFPGQTHAFDVGGWWWTDKDGKSHYHSEGEAPTYPMYNAYVEMRQKINQIAEEVFGEVLRHGK